MSVTPSFADLVAERVVERLRLTPAPITEPERVIDAAEAAAILGITRDAFDKRVQRRQVPGVVRTAGRRIQIDKARMLAGLAKRGR
jgi:predicted DNA-binding transcriptional regulator AlpA